MRSFFLFLQVLLLIGCKCHTEKHKYTISKKSVTPGTKYYFSSSTNSLTYIEIENKKVEITNDADLGFIMEYIADSLGSKRIKITYDKYKATINKDNKILNIDIDDTNNINILNKFLVALKGTSIVININNKGAITSIVGYKQLTDSLLNLMQTGNSNTKQTIQQKFPI